MPRQNFPVVLYAVLTLNQRGGKIPYLGNEGDDDAADSQKEIPWLNTRQAMQNQAVEYVRKGAENHPADGALHRLFRADMGE